MTPEVRPCPSCNGWIETRAIECRHCGTRVTPRPPAQERSEPAPQPGRSEAKSPPVASALEPQTGATEGRSLGGGSATTAAPAAAPGVDLPAEFFVLSPGVWAALLAILVGYLIASVDQREVEGTIHTPAKHYDWARFYWGVAIAALAVLWLVIRGAVVSAIRAARRR